MIGGLVILAVSFLIALGLYNGPFKYFFGKKIYSLVPSVGANLARELRVVFPDLDNNQAGSISTIFIKQLNADQQALAHLLEVGAVYRKSRLNQLAGQDISGATLTPDELALVNDVQNMRAGLLPLLKRAWPHNLEHLWDEYSEADQRVVMMTVWERVSLSL